MIMHNVTTENDPNIKEYRNIPCGMMFRILAGTDSKSNIFMKLAANNDLVIVDKETGGFPCVLLEDGTTYRVQPKTLVTIVKDVSLESVK